MKVAIGHFLNVLYLYEALQLSAAGVLCQQESHAIVVNFHRLAPVHCASVQRAEHTEVVACGTSQQLV